MSEIDKVIRISANSLVDSMYRGKSPQKRELVMGFVESAILASIAVSEALLGNDWVDPHADESWVKNAAEVGMEPGFEIPDGIPDKNLVEIYKMVGWGPDALGKFIASILKQKPELRPQLEGLVGMSPGEKPILPAGKDESKMPPAPSPEASAGAPKNPAPEKKPKIPIPPGESSIMELSKKINQEKVGPEPVRNPKVSRDSVGDANIPDEFTSDSRTTIVPEGGKR